MALTPTPPAGAPTEEASTPSISIEATPAAGAPAATEAPSPTPTVAAVNCSPPFAAIGGECCLDENYNDVCDEEEEIETTPNETIEVEEAPAPVCGNALCEPSENSTSCCKDCGCSSGSVCVNNSCARFVYVPGTNFTVMEVCGNGYCKPGVENQSSCCKDCGCPSGQVCSRGACSNITFVPPSLTPMNVTPTDAYIVVVIDEIIVHDDEDPTGAGELMLFTFAASGERIQKMHWPSGIWYSVDSGGKIEKRIPVFALKESEMGELLAISVTAIDNDQLPGWLETLVSIITAPVDLLLIVAASAGATVYESVSDMELDLEVMTGRALRDALTGNEEIGSINKVYEKTNKWGARDEQYEVRGGGMTVKYSIRRVLVPKNSKYSVRVYNVSFSDSGDYYNGEVWINARAAANFGERDLAATFLRIPTRGTMSLGDGSLVQGVKMFAPNGTLIGRLDLFRFEGSGPFVFLEVSAWDEDNPDVGDDHDNIGELSWVYLYSDFDLPPTTMATTYSNRVEYPWIYGNNTVTTPFITRGNMRLAFEITRHAS